MMCYLCLYHKKMFKRNEMSETPQDKVERTKDKTEIPQSK